MQDDLYTKVILCLVCLWIMGKLLCRPCNPALLAVAYCLGLPYTWWHIAAHFKSWVRIFRCKPEMSDLKIVCFLNMLYLANIAARPWWVDFSTSIKHKHSLESYWPFRTHQVIITDINKTGLIGSQFDQIAKCHTKQNSHDHIGQSNQVIMEI